MMLPSSNSLLEWALRISRQWNARLSACQTGDVWRKLWLNNRCFWRGKGTHKTTYQTIHKAWPPRRACSVMNMVTQVAALSVT